MESLEEHNKYKKINNGGGATAEHSSVHKNFKYNKYKSLMTELTR